jgi:hypothetical protein
MTSCNGTSGLYCSPAQNAILTENQTYSLDYNPQFASLNNLEAVDVYLYHADDSALATSIPDIANNGELSFTVDKV